MQYGAVAEVTRNDSPFFSTLTPGPGARRAAAAVALAALLVFLAIAPFAKTPLAPMPAFLPVYQSALVVFDLLTAILLWGQYGILRSRALLVLAAGYLFSALMATAHALSFPGLFAPGGWLTGGPQTTAWLYFLWHGGFPLFFVGYALLKQEKPAAGHPPGGRGRHVAASMLAAAGCAGVLVVLATAAHDALPRIMTGNTDSPAKVVVAALTWLFGIAALATLWRRRPHSVLDLWLLVVLCAWLADSALASVFNHARYDLGWYAGRVFGLAASGFVLGALLLENSVLYARLAEAHTLLRDSNAQLAQASRLKSEFLANMSHELRTPLNAIIGFSEVLRDGLAGELTPDQKEYTGDIHSSGQHLLSLINDILDLSKIEAGQMSLDLEPVAANTLFEHSLSMVRERAARGGLRLHLDVPQELGTLLLDARKARQILYNLLSNAVKFSGEGASVTLAARRVPRVEARGWQGGRPTALQTPWPDTPCDDYLEFSVEDTGIGIAPEDAPRLFRMFSQLDSSLARQAEGTGLGLALVDRLAQLHGGAVAVSSTPGQGSRFVVWLPWREAEAEGAASGAQPAAARAAPAPAWTSATAPRPRALVIEDNDHAAELIRLQLEPEGYEVVRASSGRQALAWLATGQPAVVILDILLPDMDGWDLLSLLKQPSSPAGRVPVVIVSIVADAPKGFSLGASAVLQKPVSREELLGALNDIGIPGVRPLSRVLIVDDDRQAVDLLATYLQGPAYQVLRAHGGRDGIAAARRALPDLIVLDLMMPEVSGFDVVEQLKDSPDTALIPIVVVTAKVLSEEDKRTLHGLVAVVLQKATFDHGRFMGEVRRAIMARPGAVG